MLLEAPSTTSTLALAKIQKDAISYRGSYANIHTTFLRQHSKEVVIQYRLQKCNAILTFNRLQQLLIYVSACCIKSVRQIS